MYNLIVEHLNYFMKINKGIGGVEGLFYFFILFNLVLTKLQDAFYRF